MKKTVELPLLSPMYSTYHFHNPGTSIIVDNPSIRNWYLNRVLILTCSRKFLSGYTTPEIGIVQSSWRDNPFIETKGCNSQFLKGYIHPVIRNMLDAGYYVAYNAIDDYYVKGKSWYHKRHFSHDGLICGYNQEDKTYCIYAYDSNWILQKFWTPQSGFEAGRKAMFQKGVYSFICGLKPKSDIIEFSAKTAVRKIKQYLDSTMEQYPEDGEGSVYGIVVHDYIAKYVNLLFEGTIPYEKMDYRVFRLIWEHKKAMLERLECIENTLGIEPDISKKYEPLVAEANTVRMLYASHHMKRRDSILPVIQKRLLLIKDAEQIILSELIEKTGELLKNETLE